MPEAITTSPVKPDGEHIGDERMRRQLATVRQPRIVRAIRSPAWSYSFSPSFEQRYIQNLAVKFSQKLPHANTAEIEQQLTALVRSYRARHQGTVFANSDGPYSIEGAVAYLAEQSAIALGDRALPSDADRVELAIAIILKRTPSALVNASNEDKQKLYEYAVIWGAMTQRNLASHSMSPMLRAADRSYLNAYSINLPLVTFVYDCFDTRSCNIKRQLRLQHSAPAHR